jgi:DNA-binding NtrC family response regulator
MKEEPRLRFLIVDDEQSIRRLCMTVGQGLKFVCSEAETAEAALAAVETAPVDIVVSDLKLPSLSGTDLLRKIKEMLPRAEVAIMTGHGSIESAVEAMRQGAYDYIEKPFRVERLRQLLQRMAEKVRLVTENQFLRERVDAGAELGGITGTSAKIQDVLRMVSRLKDIRTPVLITGESGTGKELVARTLHDLSPRKPRPFVAVNCAAIPETLIDSELFGHEKGSFTGAVERRAGCFELATGGTLLLDELGEMPAGTQAKLLRVLEERKLRRIGGRTEQDVDVRVLAATNRDPAEAIARGELRSDLFYRLNVFHIDLPPLREHIEDLPAMADAMVSEMNQKHGRKVSGVGQSILDRMIAYDWPGNARELRNSIERAVILCPDGAPLDAGHLPPTFGRSQAQSTPVFDASVVAIRVGTTVDEAERLLILRTLESTGQNKTRAAEILGVSLKTLHNKLKEYSHSREDQPA